MTVASTHSHELIGDPGAATVWRLIVALAPRPPTTQLIAVRGPLVLGRDPTQADVVLDDVGVSRAHLRLALDGAGVTVTDLASRHGTFVDGRRATAVRVDADAVVRLGGTVLLLTRADVPTGVRLAPADDDLAGASLAMDRVRGEIELVAGHAMAVLIHGEPGVGKERVARAIHRGSQRRGPLVAVNCASIAAGLADSELFGHAAGAFTGAAGRNDGLFVAADGGTLFLDEIAELSLEVQAKLLRVLETGEVRAVGAAATRQVDVRLVAATHADLRARVAAGRFRGDLYSRIATWVLTVPPLRERREDILAFLRHGLGARAATTVTAAALEALLLHAWPYNVRELLGVVTAAGIRASGQPIGLAHLPAELAALVEAAPATTVAAPPLRLQVDRDAIPDPATLRAVLEELGGNISKVAALFGRSRRQVYRWCDDAGLVVRRSAEIDETDG